MTDTMNTPGTSLWFWKHTGLFGRGHVCYSPGSWWLDGPFTNPARMCEDMGDPFFADVWMHAGWWDPARIDGTMSASNDAATATEATHD